MKTDQANQTSVREIVVYALAYALWLITMVMSIVAVLQIRVAVSALSVLNGADQYTVPLVDQACLLLLGLAAFIYVIWLEHYYREAVILRTKPKLTDKVPPLPKGGILQGLGERGLDLLSRRFAFTFALPLGLFLLSLVAYERTLDAMTALH